MHQNAGINKRVRPARRTCGASNPTYTVFALSLRAAENLVWNWGAVAG
jgi:hypothetical protein